MSQGYARVIELEPGMEFRRHRDAGELTFSHVESAGVSMGRRWVVVFTRGDFAFLCEWDTQVLLVEEG